MNRLSANARSLCFGSLALCWVSVTFSTALTEISFVCALIFWLLSRKNARALIAIPERRLWLPLALYLGICILSVCWSQYPMQSIRGIFKILQLVTLFWMTSDILAEPAFLKKFECLFIAWLVLLVADGFWQYYFDRDFIRNLSFQDAHAGVRVSASFKTYGLFASYLLCTIPYLAMLGLRFRSESKKSRLLWYLCLVLTTDLVILLFLTRSRGAILAFILAVLLPFILQKKFVWLGLFLALGTASFFLLPRSMIFHFDSNFQEQSLIERFVLWDRAVQVIRAKPLTGTGINTYTRAHPQYDTTQNWRVKNYYAHNGYLQLAAETGLPGLFIFLFFLYAYYRETLGWLKRNAGHPQAGILWGLLTGISGFLIMMSGDTVFHNSSAVLIFWYLMGLTVAYRRSGNYEVR